MRGGTVEKHRFLYKVERVRQCHHDGTATRKEMEDLLEKERNRQTEAKKGDIRVGLTKDGHMPVRERWNGE